MLSEDFEKLKRMQRVVVIGTSGSGKTTLAANIARVKGWPHIPLDAVHFLPNWVERSLDDFRTRTLTAVQSSNCWALDGNYSKVRDITWGHATTLIWLNYAFPVVFWRVFIRTMQRSLSGKDVLPGCRETFGKSFFSAIRSYCGPSPPTLGGGVSSRCCSASLNISIWMSLN